VFDSISPLSLMVILLTSLIASLISGIAGFGGALFLLPVISLFIDIKLAVPILTIGQIFGNGSRVFFGRKDLSWKPILYFLLTALPLTVVGSYLFTVLNGQIIKLVVGILLLLLVSYRRINKKEYYIKNNGMLVGGSLTGFISGIAGSAGPLGAAFFLGLGLTPSSYIASEAVTALSMHIVKTVVYQKYSDVGLYELYIGVLVGSVMILGSWIGKKIIGKIKKEYFIYIVEFLMVITGIQMIIGYFT